MKFNILFPLALVSRARIAVYFLLVASFVALVMWDGERVHAASFTSTMSGSWGNSATWGGAGVPGAGDDVTIASGTTVTLDATRSSKNLTINSGGTLDLLNQEFDFANNAAAFTNNGTLTNTGGGVSAPFIFQGNFTPGAIVQSLNGAGTYSSKIDLILRFGVTVNVGPSTSMTFDSAQSTNNLQLGFGDILDLTNALTVTAPSSGPNYVVIDDSPSGTISGAGGLKTQGNVNTRGASTSFPGTFTAPFEVVSGAQQGDGRFSGAFKIDSGASLQMAGALTFDSDLTIQSTATLDLNGSPVVFGGNNTTFTNNGTLTNTAGFSFFNFQGNSTAGGIVQSFSGAGTYSSNLRLALNAGVTVNVSPSTSVTFNSASGQNNLTVNSTSTLDLTNALTVTAPASGAGVGIDSSSGTISGAGGLKTQGKVNTVNNYISASFTSPFEVVSGAQTGKGRFSGAFKIDSGASFQGSNTLLLESDLTIQSTATLDLHQALFFTGNNTTFTNNGTLTGGFSPSFFFFDGNSTPGAILQSLNGAGTYSANVQVSLTSSVTVVLNSDAQLSAMQIDSGSVLDITNRTLKLSGPGTALTVNGTIITTGSTVEMNGTAAQTVATANVSYNKLTINNVAGVNLAAAETVPGTVTLTNGVFTIGSNLTMGNGALIRRSDGSLSGTPIFGTTVNVEYFGANAIATGTELPASGTVLNNLTVNKSGGATLGGNATVNGTLFLTSGVFSSSSSTLTINNGITVGAGSLASGVTGTVIYNQAGDGQAVLVCDYGNLTFSNFNKTLPSSATVRIAGTFNAGTGSGHTITGSTIEYNGSSAQTLPPGFGTYNNLTLNNTAGTTGFAGLTVNGLLRVQAGTFTSSSNYHDVQIDSGATLAATAASTINVSGNWTNNGGTFTPSTGTVVFNSSTAGQTIGGTSSSQTFNNITVTKSGQTLSVGGSTTTLSVNTLILNAGTFSASTATAINVIGDWSNNGGTFTPGSAVVTFNNTSGAQNINGSASSQTFNSIVAAKSSQTLSVAGSTTSLTLNGTLTLTSGTFNAGTATSITVGGDWTNNGGTFTPGSSTVTFNSASAPQAINGSAASQSFNGLTVNKSGQTLSVGGSTATLNITGALTLSAGTVDAGTATAINVGGNWTNNSTFTPGLGTVAFNGNNNTQTLSGSTTFNNLTINHSGTGNVTASGSTLAVNSLLRVQAGTFISSSTLKDVQIDNGATLQSDGGTMNVSGNWTNNGTFTPSSGTVNFNGSVAQTIGGSSTTTFNNLSINNSNGVSLNGDITIGATLTLSAGALAIGSRTLTLNNAVSITGGSFTSNANGTVNYNQSSDGQNVAPGNYGNLTFSNFTKTLPSAGTVKIAGTFTTGATGGHNVTGSTVEYNGASAQTIPSGFTTYNNLTLNNAAGVTGAPGLIVQNLIRVQAGTFTTSSSFKNVQIDNGATLAAAAGTTINVSGNWTNNGSFTANTGTVNYNGSAAQDIGGSSATTFNNLTISNSAGVSLSADATVGAALTLTSGAFGVGVRTLTLNGASTAASGTLTSGATGSVIYNQLSDGQSVLAASYGNLTFSNFNKVLPSSVIGIVGTFTPGTAIGHTITGNTIDFNGGGSQAIPSFNYNNLTSSNSGARALQSSGAIGVAGTFTPGTNSYTVVSSTIDFKGGGSQTIPAFNYNNLTSSNSGARTLQSSGTIGIAGAFTPGASSYTITGSTIAYNGASAQSAPASFAVYNNLSINNSAGVTLAAGITVNGVLALTSGTVATNVNTLTLGGAASSNRTSGYVIGNLKKTFSSAAAFTFDVGTANGYSPVDTNVTAGTGDLTVRAVQGPQPNVAIPSKALQRYWALSGSGITTDLTFNYLDPVDIPPTANESAFHLFKYNGAFTDLGAAGLDTTNNKYTIVGVSTFSDFTLAEVGAPTEITFEGFSASGILDAAGRDAATLLEWRTGMEVSNLGFHIHREEDGKLTRITTELIAGSALFAGAGTVLTSGRSYKWVDARPASADTRYWVEEIDLAGNSRLYGPFLAGDSKLTAESLTGGGTSALISELGKRRVDDLERTRSVEAIAQMPDLGDARTLAKVLVQTADKLGLQTAVRLGVTHEGWYRITQPELARAGLDPKVNSRLLQVFVDGIEQPIKVTGEDDGSFDPEDAVEFYGVGIDSPYANTRSYWLTVGRQSGRRITEVEGREGRPAGSSFPYTVERRDRTIYFASLRNGERENFFGAVISRSGADQTLAVNRLLQEPAVDAEFEVVLQGVTAGPHLVGVQVNGAEVERMSFAGQEQGVRKISIAQSLLREGQNVVTLAALAGDGDVSLVDHLRLTYHRAYTADNDFLAVSASANEQVKIDGFSNEQIRVVDVTNAAEPVELKAKIAGAKGSTYTAVVNVPGEGQRRLLAFTTGRVEGLSPTTQLPSNWKGYSQGADYVILTRRELIESLKPLAALRESQGLRVAVIDVEDLYNEFSYGQKTPQAIKDFLGFTQKGWKKRPTYVLLAGDASYDPKNYLGFGGFDLVPTKLIDTAYLETASDDWFADFNDDGLAEMYVGRLPVRTPAEAAVLVSKIVNYDSSIGKGPIPRRSVLLVADRNDGFNFEQASEQLRALVPAGTNVEEIFRGRLDDATAKKQLIGSINAGASIVNYTGHGSTNVWRSLFTTADIPTLENGQSLPLFITMTCLNGFIQDPVTESLAKGLIKAERGGAIAVWSSSGLTLPAQQALINQQLYRLMFAQSDPKVSPLTIGEATSRAKSATNDIDVRRTWLLVGDPTMRLK